MSTSKRLTSVLKKSPKISFDDESKIILMSDIHRGIGDWSDNFSRNQNIFFHALSFYFNEGYTYIEIGDGDELWENKNLSDIVVEHSDVYWLMSEFYKNNRLHLIYGNHDICKKKCKLIRKEFNDYYIKAKEEQLLEIKDITIHEGIILVHKEKDYKILLTHGHQGDLICDALWPLGQFLVRHVWKNLENFGVNYPIRTAKNYKRKNKIEDKIAMWSDTNKQMIITGHTHRPRLPKPKESLYLNDGSAVHPRCITGIEMNKGFITLIKWSVKSKDDGTLYITREVLAGPYKLNDYFK